MHDISEFSRDIVSNDNEDAEDSLYQSCDYRSDDESKMIVNEEDEVSMS